MAAANKKLLKAGWCIHERILKTSIEEKKIIVFVLSNLLWVLGMAVVIVVMSSMFMAFQSSEESVSSGVVSGNKNLAPEVLAHKSTVEKYASEKGISSEVPFLLAIMMVESGGKGLDPMQSSESAGLDPNGISGPELSIKQGVAHYYQTLQNAKKAGMADDKKAIVQGYNYGSYYPLWLQQNAKRHSVDVAEMYSRDYMAPIQRANGFPSAGTKYNYVNAVSQKDGRTYLYRDSGNFFYAELCFQYIAEGSEGTDATGDLQAGMDGFVVPLKNYTISSPFGYRILNGAPDLHRGLDMAANEGEPIYASKAGTVTISTTHKSWGNYIVIQHEGGAVTLYAHQSRLVATVGRQVKQGELIGYVGNTGDSLGRTCTLKCVKIVV
ncbi:lysozyme family protein [Enterococcus rivorum]|uniref:lysozyme family protein n=1 Tax=Enterococcus rivorum TaxID=762845 RepID=UPI00363BD055